jgi:hypothetical protein
MSVMVDSACIDCGLVRHIRRSDVDRNPRCRPCGNRFAAIYKRPKKTNTMSTYRGVIYLNSGCAADRRWRARIEINGQKVFIGDFKTEEEAGAAYERAALRAWGIE